MGNAAAYRSGHVRPAVALLLLAALALATRLDAQAPQSTSTQAPLRLRQAIAEALRASPALHPSEDQIALAEVQQRLASSSFGLKVHPSVSSIAEPHGFSHEYIGLDVAKRFRTGTDVTTTFGSYRYGVNTADVRDVGYTVGVSQSLVQMFGPARTFELARARRAVTGARREGVEVKQQLVLQVAEAFLTVLRQQHLIAAAERGLTRAGRLRRASEARASVGLATRLDVLRADLLVSQSESNLSLQREALSSAGDRLKALMGRALDAPLEVASESEDSDLLDFPGRGEREPSTAASLDSLVLVALRTRTDLIEARDRVGEAQRAANVARWNLLPDFRLDVGYIRRGLGTSVRDPLYDAFNGWRVGMTTAYSVDRAAELAAIQTGRIGVRAAERAVADTEREVMAEVRQSYRALGRATEGIVIQQKAVAIAERQLRVAELRYEYGLADNFDVIDAEGSLLQAQSSLIAARVDRALARLTLDRMTGTLDPEQFLK